MRLGLISTAMVSLAAGCFSTQQAFAQDAAVRVMASNGIKAALEELQPQCQRVTGNPLALQFSSTAALKKRVEAGEGFDVTVIASEAITDLVKEGKLEGGTRRDVARSELGIGIKTGAARPDIRTTDALKRALQEAKSITYPQDGATRSDIERMFESLGTAAEVKSKIILAPSSGAATESERRARQLWYSHCSAKLSRFQALKFSGAAAAVSIAARDMESAKALIAGRDHKHTLIEG